MRFKTGMLPHSEKRMTSYLHGRSVIVVGAGLAGLSAAVELLRDGATVCLLEARDRVGGRIWTIREGFTGGQHAEAGGEFIDEDHDEIRRLACQLNVELVPVLKTGFSFATPQAGTTKLQLSAGSELWTDLHHRLLPLIRAYRLADQRWDSSVASQLARISAASWLDHIGAAKELRALAASLRGFFLSDPPELSLLILVEQLIAGVPGRGGLYRVRGGNDQLTKGLAAILGEAIHLEYAVVKVAQSAKKILVTARQKNGTQKTFRADYAIITVPVPVIRSICFEPPLSPPQREAVAKLPYGPATKTLLQFERRFWRNRHRRRAYATNLPIGTIWEANEEQRGQSGILTLLAGGSASQATHNLMVKGGIGRIVSELSWLGRGSRDLLAFKQIRWEKDPWAGGGYAAFTTSYDPALRQWLTRPHGRCFFAGEHTSIRWQGYMNGAIESGLRAALDVVTASQGQAPNRRWG